MTAVYATSILSISYASPSDVLIVSILLPALCIIAVLLRFYVRVSWKQGVGIDDWFLVPALLMVIGIGVSMVVGVKKRVVGYPTPPPDADTEEDYLNNLQPEIVIIQQLEFVVTLLLVLAYGCIKLSILYFYRRLFVTQQKIAFNYLTWISIAIIAAWTTAFLFLFIFSCGKSVAANWGSRQDLITYCGTGHAHELSLYISELLTNVMVLVLPMPTIWRLQMKTSRKLAVSGILILAFSALAASIVRLIITIEITAMSYTVPFDQDQVITTIFFYGTLEASLALIASCLPTLRVLVTSKNLHSILASARSATKYLPSIRKTEDSEASRIANRSYASYGRPRKGPKPAGNGYMRFASTMELGRVPLRGDVLMESRSRASRDVEEAAVREGPSVLGRIRVKREVELRDDII